MKRVLLSSAIVALLCGGQAWAQSAVPTNPAPQPTVAVAVAVPSAQPTQAAPATNVLRPTATSNASVGALQQALSQQGAGTPSAPAISVAPSSAPAGLPANFENADESTLLREMGKQQARLSFMKMMAQIEKERISIERERLKFEQEKLELRAGPQGANPAGGPLPAGGAMGFPPLPSASPALSPAATAAAATAGSLVTMIEAAQPVVRSIYSVGGQYFAEIIINGAKTVASVGKTLADGSRVLAINASGVVLSQRGKRLMLGVSAPAVATTTTPAP